MTLETGNNRPQYVPEWLWFPTYSGIALVVLLGFESATALTAVCLFLALIVSRMVLEFAYRLVLGQRRLSISGNCAAFSLQLVILGLFMAWYFSVIIPA